MADKELGLGLAILAAIFGCGWLLYVINSVARAADALERIADALEDDEPEDESEEAK